MAAVRVRRVKPYNLVISEAIVVGIAISLAASKTTFSGSPLSTPKAMEETKTFAPSCSKPLILSSTRCILNCFNGTKSLTISIFLLLPKSISFKRV